MKFLEDTYKLTGLSVNKAKSCYVTGRTNGPSDAIIKSITGFQIRDLLMKYLGCPLYMGRTKALLFLHLINKLHSKLGAWKGKILSFE